MYHLGLMSNKLINCGEVIIQKQGRVSIKKILARKGLTEGDSVEVFIRIPLAKQLELIKQIAPNLYVQIAPISLKDENDGSILVSDNQYEWIDVTNMDLKDAENLIRKTYPKMKMSWDND